MSVSARSLLVPGVAMVAASAVALGPSLVAPPAVTLAQPTIAVPTVHIDDIRLAGIGQDIYYAIQPWVAYGVELAQWATAWIPPVSSQIGILYFAGIQPVVEATVNALAGIVQNPFNIIATLSAYGASLGVIGYNFVAAEAAWLGFPLPPLPPLPPLASVSGSSAPLAAAARTANGRRSVAVAEVSVPAEVTADVAAAVPTPARESRGGVGRATRSAISGARQVADDATSEANSVAQQTDSEVRNTARATRGAVVKAAKNVRTAATAAAG
ncbi:MAG: hypothetical protein WCJ53_01030 [Mycobacteriaceae bacterium]